MTLRRAAPALAIVFIFSLSHCGGSTRPPEPRNEAATASSGGAGGADAPTTIASEEAHGSRRAPRSSTSPARERGEGAAPPPSAPGIASGGATTTVADMPSESGPGRDVSYWQGRMDQALSSLSGAGGECRDVCRASADICVAAHEICGLTGDGETSAPQDPRCSRARGACEQATRQRNGSCPVCPTSN